MSFFFINICTFTKPCLSIVVISLRMKLVSSLKLSCFYLIWYSEMQFLKLDEIHSIKNVVKTNRFWAISINLTLTEFKLSELFKIFFIRSCFAEVQAMCRIKYLKNILKINIIKVREIRLAKLNEQKGN